MTLPVLGLCCLTSDGLISYKTITKTRFSALNEEDQYNKLIVIYEDNISMFTNAVIYCARNSIGMYRVTSHLFPFYETNAGTAALNKVSNSLAVLGELIEALKVRVVMHPDQWVVLSSDTTDVIARSVQELVHHANIFDLMGSSQSHYNLLNVHGGKRGNSATLINTIRELPDNVRSRLTLENDERSYGVAELMGVSEKTQVPILFDFHHSLVKNRHGTYDHKNIQAEYRLSKSTWENPEWITTHISNGFTDMLDNKHSDFITRFPEYMLDANTVPYVEVEARMKEQAIVKLRNLMETYYA